MKVPGGSSVARYTVFMALIVGIDEVGRGPLAGPVSVGIVVVRKPFTIPGLTDSKKMTPRARLAVWEVAQEMTRMGDISFGVFSSEVSTIEECGIVAGIERAIARGLRTLLPTPDSVEVFLDGGLHAPRAYRQETIVRGDSLVPAISLASVLAKVSRDTYMASVAEKRFPGYGFSKHKGYGTAEHIAALKRLGPSPIHRMSFLSGLVLR